MASTDYTLLIANSVGFATLIATQAFKIYWDLKARKETERATREHRALELQKLDQTVHGVQATQETIQTLEKNTNSIKDALVKVTGEAAFAKGLKEGEQRANEGLR